MVEENLLIPELNSVDELAAPRPQLREAYFKRIIESANEALVADSPIIELTNAVGEVLGS